MTCATVGLSRVTAAVCMHPWCRRCLWCGWLVALCLWLSGCCLLFGLPDRQTQRQVDVAEVVGVWKLTDDTLAILQRDGFVVDPSHAYTLTFEADGTLHFASVLDDFRSGVYREVTGTWQLRHDTSTGIGMMRNVLELSLPRAGGMDGRIFYFYFAEDRSDGRLVMWNYYSDPDLWEFIEYLRVP